MESELVALNKIKLMAQLIFCMLTLFFLIFLVYVFALFWKDLFVIGVIVLILFGGFIAVIGIAASDNNSLKEKEPKKEN